MTEEQKQQIVLLSDPKHIRRLSLSEENIIRGLAKKLKKELPISGAEAFHLSRIHRLWGDVDV